MLGGLHSTHNIMLANQQRLNRQVAYRIVQKRRILGIIKNNFLKFCLKIKN